MGASELRDRVIGTLADRSFSLRADALGVRSIQTTLRTLCSDGVLALTDAELSEDQAAGTITITGKGPMFAQTRLDVRATFVLDDELPALVLEVSGFTQLWTLSSSFPVLKGSYIDGYALRNAKITIDSRGQELDASTDADPPAWQLPRDFQTELGLEAADPALYQSVLRGLTFEAEMDLGPLNVMAWLLGGERARVSGPMELVEGAPRMWCRSEVMSAIAVSGVSLTTRVSLVSVLGKAGSSPSTTQTKTQTKTQTLEPTARGFVLISAVAGFGSGTNKLELPLAARVETAKLEQLTFSVGTADLSRLAFDSLTKAAGATGVLDGMKGVFPDFQKVVLERVSFTLHLRTRTVLTLGFVVSLDATLDAIPDRVSMQDFRVSFLCSGPGTRWARWRVWTTFAASCFGAKFRGNMSLTEFGFSAYLDEGESIDLGAIVEQLIPELSGPPLRCKRLDLSGNIRDASFGVFVVIDGDWTIPIGVTSLTVAQLSVQISAGAKKRASAVLGGVLSLGSVELAVNWVIPGSPMIEGRLGDLRLAETTRALLGDELMRSLPFPSSLLDWTLEDVIVTADLERRSFSLAASAAGFGRTELFVEKPQGAGWGVGLGVTLDASFKFSNIDKSLSALDALSIANAYILLSSFGPRELSMPGQPAGAGRVQRGVNFYLPVLLGNSGVLEPLAKVIGDDGASLMLRGALTTEGCTLEAAMAGFEIASGVTFESAGFRMSFEYDGDIAIAVFGRVAVDLAERLLFEAEMQVQPSGLSLAATMQGTWQKAFGVPGFTLANVALTVGVNVAGLPSVGLAGSASMGSFSGSFAVLINSIDPAESVLSLQFNELTLGTFLESAIEPKARKQLPKEILKLFDSGFRDVDIYICPESTYIGKLYYQQGFRFKAKTNILGWKAEIDASADWATGIRIEGSAEPLRLGRIGKSNTYVLEITEADKDKLFAAVEKKSKGVPNAFAGRDKDRGKSKSEQKPALPEAATNAVDEAKQQIQRMELSGVYLDGRKAKAQALLQDYQVAAGAAVSVELWVEIPPPGKGKQPQQRLLWLGGAPKAGRMELFLNPAGKLVWKVGTGNGQAIQADFSPYRGRWVHVAAACGGKQRKQLSLWIDGQRVADATPDQAFAPALTGLTLGGSQGTRYRLAQLRVWSRVRTDAEILGDRFKLLGTDTPDLQLASSLDYDSLRAFDMQQTSPATDRVAPPGDPAYALLLWGLRCTDTGAVGPETKDLPCANDLSVEAWIKPDRSGQGKVRALVSKDAKAEFSLELDKDNRLVFLFGTPTGPSISISAAPVVPDVWQHVAACRRGTRVELYLDGRPVPLLPMPPLPKLPLPKSKTQSKTGSKTTTLVSKEPITVGSRSRNAASFSGAIAEIRLWNHARSPDDIRAYARRELTGGEAGFLAYWPCDEGEGDRIQDFATIRHLRWAAKTWEGAAMFAPGVDARADARAALNEQTKTNSKTSTELVPVTAAKVLGGPQIRAVLSLQESPSFMLSARVALLGFYEEQVLIEAGKDGLAFALSRKSGGVSSSIACVISDKGFDASGSLEFKLKLSLDIYVPGTKTKLGRVKLDTGLAGRLRIKITNKVFRVEVDGSFTWEGNKLELPTVIISTPVPDISRITNQVLDEIERGASKIFEDVLGAIGDLTKAMEKGWIAVSAGAEDLGEALLKVYKIDPDQAAKTLKAAGHTAENVVKVLSGPFKVNDKAAREALAKAGFNPKDIDKAVGKVFKDIGKTAENVGKDIGKGVSDIGKGIGKLF